MNIPKIKFRKMTLQENIDIIQWAYCENDGLVDLSTCITQYFPELANLDTNLSKAQVLEKIEKIVTINYCRDEKKIESEVERYNQLWKKYNDIYFQELSDFLGVDWPQDIDIIEGSVGLTPVAPRDLDLFSFSLNIGVADRVLIDICAHETLHFLWCEKWKRIHPEISREEFDSPYLVWQYSEMVIDPILNNKPFSNIFDFTVKSYDCFYELKDGDELVMNHLRKIYSEEDGIDNKINNGFYYIQEIIKDTKNESTVTRKKR